MPFQQFANLDRYPFGWALGSRALRQSTAVSKERVQTRLHRLCNRAPQKVTWRILENWQRWSHMVLDWIRLWFDASAQSYFTRFIDTAKGLPKYCWTAAKWKETMLFQRLTKSSHRGSIAGFEVGELDDVCQSLRRQGTSLGQKAWALNAGERFWETL